MRVLSLELKNVRQFTDRRFEFGPGFNLLVGENGAGKSTVLRSLLTVLPGAANFRPSDRLSDDDIRHRERELHVSADFLHNNETASAGFSRRWREKPTRPGRATKLPIIWFGSNESVARPFQSKKIRRYRGRGVKFDFDRDELMFREEYLYREEFMDYPEDEERPTFGSSHVVRRFVAK